MGVNCTAEVPYSVFFCRITFTYICIIIINDHYIVVR